eukprot:scaffold926_cov248-Pinguiococcus_pyrenoidosus.AAC.30
MCCGSASGSVQSNQEGRASHPPPPSSLFDGPPPGLLFSFPSSALVPSPYIKPRRVDGGRKQELRFADIAIAPGNLRRRRVRFSSETCAEIPAR